MTPIKPIIVPKQVVVTRPIVPLKQMTATRPTIVASPIIAKQTITKPTPLSNPVPTAEWLNNELSQATLTISEVSKVLGNPGPARELLAYATKIMAELKNLRTSAGK